MRISTAILLFVLVQATAGCGSSSPAAAPSPTPTPTPSPAPEVRLAVFSDPDSSFSTSDVRDAQDQQDQIVRFDMANNTLMWAGRSFPGYPVSGNFVRSDKNLQILFGTKDGERRAYFTETATGTVYDIEVVNSQLVISPTNVSVPGRG